jgi:hypothetical protein
MPQSDDIARLRAEMDQAREAICTAKVGQRYRDDGSGYLWDVVKVEPSGDAWCRHPNQRLGAVLTRRAWFDQWTLIRDADGLSR